MKAIKITHRHEDYPGASRVTYAAGSLIDVGQRYPEAVRIDVLGDVEILSPAIARPKNFQASSALCRSCSRSLTCIAWIEGGCELYQTDEAGE